MVENLVSLGLFGTHFFFFCVVPRAAAESPGQIYEKAQPEQSLLHAGLSHLFKL